MTTENLNPALVKLKENETQSLTTTERARARASIEASLTVAAARPRDEAQAISRIANSCQRIRLAEQSSYTYAKGGQEISGPSITLVTQVALAWGNIDWGYKELSRGAGESTVEAYAWDQQSNARYSRQFIVAHRIRAGGRQRQLREDELADWIANQAQRRVRTCLENVIPRDIIDEALDECGKTLKASVQLDREKITSMIEAFEEMGVSREQLSNRVQRSLESIEPAQYLAMRRLYTSIKDGLTTLDQAFPAQEKPQEDNEKGSKNASDN